jgi:hypothetical protein
MAFESEKLQIYGQSRVTFQKNHLQVGFFGGFLSGFFG